MRKLISKTIKLSLAAAILSVSLIGCSEDLVDPDTTSAMPPKGGVVPPPR